MIPIVAKTYAHANLIANTLGFKHGCWSFVSEANQIRGMRDRLIIVGSTAHELPEWREIDAVIQRDNLIRQYVRT